MDITKRTIGVNINKDKSASVSVWAPLAKQVELKLIRDESKKALEKEAYGYWRKKITGIGEGELYNFIIDGKDEFPDPASLHQPQGVHGPSAVIDLHEFEWSDTTWKNISLENYIFYELHTGCFSAAGNFAGIKAKLKYLKELGITAIEIMPVSQFPGDRNWGYDGVYPFAVQHSYGGAKALMELVDTCHSEGLAVVLDVVYNHIGPEGNYLGSFGPYFTDKYKTPWGGALNFDDAWCDGVRDFFIENALMWFRDFHIDALRLDAVHAIKDFSAIHILEEIRVHTDELMKQTGRIHFLIVELDLNDTRFIQPRNKGGFGMDGQWIDEFHHALRVTAGGGKDGYYSDFDGVSHLAKSYTDAYVYDGQYSEHRKKRFGIKADGRPGAQFVVFSQNHDQVGNRMLGERTSLLVSFEMQKLLAAAVIVSPFLPMFFMGEEWSEPNPFQYFVSHTDPDLADAVRKGRKKEFAAFHFQGEAPDPLSEQTFMRSKLNWNLLDKQPHGTMFNYYKALITLRKTDSVLSVPDRKNIAVFADPVKNSLILHRWKDNHHVLMLMNFSKSNQSLVAELEIRKWDLLFNSADSGWKGQGAAPKTLDFSINKNVSIEAESCLFYSTNV